MERWNPVAEMDRVLADVDRLLAQTTGRSSRLFPRFTGFSPLIDLYDTGENLVVKALIPGVSPEDVDVSLEQNTLTLSGQYGYSLPDDEARQITSWYRREIAGGRFAESVALPFPVDAEHTTATFEHGILTLVLAKAEQARVKKIPVHAAATATPLTGSAN